MRDFTRNALLTDEKPAETKNALLSAVFGEEYSLLGGKIKNALMQAFKKPDNKERLNTLFEQQIKGENPDFVNFFTGHPKSEWMKANAMLMSNAMMPLGTPMMKQIEAYHGSPHKFDKFSTKQIGTGEGGQAFGWGLYFTDKADIAKVYAKANLELEGIKIGTKDIYDVALSDKYYEKGYGGAKWAEYIKSLFDRSNNKLGAIKQLKIDSKQGNYPDEYIKDTTDVINSITEVGNVYKATLHKGKEPGDYDYLEWDKIISDDKIKKILSQAEKEKINLGIIGRSLKELGSSTEPGLYVNAGGQNIYLTPNKSHSVYNGLSGALGSDKEASLFLLRAGIDGIKYPAGTLSGGTKDNAFNYVVFDENAIDIEETESNQ